MSKRTIAAAALAAGALAYLPASVAAAVAADPQCTGAYGSAPARAHPTLRFGIDPGLAGSIGASQQHTVPDAPSRDLRALRALRPRNTVLVLRLGRLFFSDGRAGIERFLRMARADTRAGFDVELQVRYHAAAAQAGDLAAWRRYVRRVVDAFGPNPHVVAMTITNEVNLTISPNTSDGAYPRAQDALIEGIEAAHAEAQRRHFRQLTFGFTYAYRFAADAAFFARLGSHGGTAVRRDVGFVGLDFYPGTIAPAVLAPGETYGAAFAQAAGVLRRCLMPLARLGPRVPIWITENGVASDRVGDAGQARALGQLVRAAHAYSATFNITDYRWFNLRDSVAPTTPGVAGPVFAFDGLVRSDYAAKPVFAAYRSLIARLGRGITAVRNVTGDS